MLKLLADLPSAIVIDVSTMTIEDDAAATVFGAITRTAARWPGCAVLLCAADPRLHARLVELGTGRLTPMYPDLATAVAAADGQAPLRLSMRLSSIPAATSHARDWSAGHVPPGTCPT
jgi:hypothetical protein